MGSHWDLRMTGSHRPTIRQSTVNFLCWSKADFGELSVLPNTGSFLTEAESGELPHDGGAIVTGA
jgi:hypothetical protein